MILDMFLLSPRVLQYAWLYFDKKKRLMIRKNAKSFQVIKESKGKPSVRPKTQMQVQ